MMRIFIKFIAGPLFVLFMTALVCDGHFPLHQPPPPPEPHVGGGRYKPPTDLTTPNVPTAPSTQSTSSGNRAGPAVAASTPGGANGVPNLSARVKGAASMTRKVRGRTSTQVTWEYWWARNRYQYLDFTRLETSHERMFPLTRSLLANPSSTDRLKSLKQQCIHLFRPLLNDESARLRRASLTGLAMLNDQDSLPEMMNRLRDNNQTVRDSALLALGIIDSPEAKLMLLHMAKGSETACKVLDQSQIPDYFRGFAEVALALENARGVKGLLENISLDAEAQPQVKAMALEGIGLVGGEESAKFLIDFIGTAKVAPELLGAATTALGKTNEPIVVSHLQQSLFSKEMPVRQSAALSLGELARENDEQIVESLHRCFKHSNDQALKGFSLISMGRIGGSLAIEKLERTIRKGSSSERSWACLGMGLALRNIPDKNPAELLIKVVVDDANRSTRGAAAIGLGLARYEPGTELLIDQLQNGDEPECRAYTALALGMIGNYAALEPLKEALLNDSMNTVRMQAAMALAQLNDSSTASELVNLLIETPSDSIKGFVALGLSYMADVKTVERIYAAMNSNKNYDDLTMSHFIHLTSKLLSGRITPYLDRVARGSNFACEYPLVSYLLGFGI